MTIVDPTPFASRTRSPRHRWLSELPQWRPASRLTLILDLPPRLLKDIGMNPDAADVAAGHRR